MTDLHARAAADLASGPIEAPTPVLSPQGRPPLATATRAPPSATTSVPGAVPMRIPAILRLQGTKPPSHLANKKDCGGDGAVTGSSSSRKAGVAPGGKRRRRRWENAQLAGNPHLHRPSRSDFSPGPSLKNLSSTFAPPPATFSRSTYVSSSPTSAPSPASLASTSTHGHFSMSLRGLRRTLRSSLGAGGGRGGRSEEVLAVMERELCAWLTLSGRIPEGFFHESTAGAGASLAQACAAGKALDPTPLEDWVPPLASEADSLSLPDLPTSSTPSPATAPAPPTLTELSRQPHALVWLAPSPHHRFLLHALARYYSLSSFSRPLSPLEPGIRVTHVLRPQLARAARGAGLGMGPGAEGGAGAETPPGTDWTEASSVGGMSTTEAEEGLTSDADGELDDTDTDAASVLSVPLEEDEDGASAWGDGDGEAPVPTPVGAGGTDDEAEAVYSSATESSAEDTGAEAEGPEGDERAALARRFARLGVQAGTGAGLAPPATPVRLASPLARAGAGSPGGSMTPRAPAPAPAPPFSPVPTSSSDPSTPLARPTRGRRSFAGPAAGHDPSGGSSAGYASSAAESSPSRSPTRSGHASARAAFVGAEAGEWRLPERDFVAWVFD